MMLQVITWTRTPNGLAELSESAAGFTGRGVDEIKKMPFPADEVCPLDFAAKLKKVYQKEEAKRGATSYKYLFHPVMKGPNGTFPIAILLVFMREDGQWVRTVGHLFVLVPMWYYRLPVCCQAVVKAFALLLLGEAA